MEEVWKDIPGYEGIYQASNTGKIKSLPRMCGKFHKEPGRILIASEQNGYPRVALCKDGKGKNFKVHKLVALTFLGPRPEGQEVMHLDGNKKNPELPNLRYGSRKCNAAFKIDHGTYGKNRKLNMYQIGRIREYLSVGITGAELARHFKVSGKTIYSIRDGESYNNI